MLLIDDLLLAPFTGLLWVFDKIHDAADEQLAGEATAMTEQLRQLYRLLETGQITEAEFDAEECLLLDRLETIRESEHDADEEDEEDEAETGEGERAEYTARGDQRDDDDGDASEDGDLPERRGSHQARRAKT